MGLLNVLCWVGGIACFAIGYLRARPLLRRAQELREQEENIRRYETWRGRPTVDAGPSSAEMMGAELRKRALVWVSLGVAGAVLVFLGFLIR